MFTIVNNSQSKNTHQYLSGDSKRITLDIDTSNSAQLSTVRENNFFDKNRIFINVGGVTNEISWSTLERIPNTRLFSIKHAKDLMEIKNLCDDFNAEKNEIFFDRSPTFFNTVINFYRTGKLHIIDEGCIMAFKEDLDYWGIDDNYIEPCCYMNFHQRFESIQEDFQKEKEFNAEDELKTNNKFSCTQSSIRKCVWDLMDNPQTSTAAKVIAIISMFFVVLSTLTLTLNTIPDLRTKVFNESILTNNLTEEAKSSLYENESNYYYADNKYFELIEVICIAWFTLEYCLRFWAAPKKWEFFKAPLNIIDLISILPFYVQIIMSSSHLEEYAAQTNGIRRLLTLFRVLRVLRIFKLARHSTGLQSLGYTLQMSYKELGLLLMFLSIAVLLFSSLAYFAEHEELDTQFTSIPSTFWWALITITTVGYGDIVPTTFFGKMIGSCCCVFGIIVIALPIPIIVDNFAAFYKEQKAREKSKSAKEKRKKKIEELEGLKILPESPNEEVSSPFITKV